MKSTTAPMTCDTCKQPINTQQEAFVEWLETNGTITDVHIVHKVPYSPNAHCFQHQNRPNRNDLELETVLEIPQLKKDLGLI
ncbi:hypothetical protein A6E13_19850 [Aliivibrio fischeri]|uniref:hypothetical protein n=1 Tax=Aliivibrio fischeri TaxID=668 RepID=UPI00080EA4B3|nr:hypothetical protein [Aliivibrio fischeri]OCH27148.1 hypothetical protein A6E13_19850 [Aliivibrio fischeri]